MPTPIPTTDPSSIPLQSCHWCEGSGWESIDGIGPCRCTNCMGGLFAVVSGNLGSTRAYPKGRPFSFNPGLGHLAIRRGKVTTAYLVREFPADNDFLSGLPVQVAAEPARAFEFVKATAATRYHCLVARNWRQCDCQGKTAESSAKANERAFLDGEDVIPTDGCVHLDFIVLAMAAGLLDLPNAFVPDEVSEEPVARTVEECVVQQI